MTAQSSIGRLLARTVSSVPATLTPTEVRERITTYYASYANGDVTGREALFSPKVRFEDPAGRVVATDTTSLHTFFTQSIPPEWSIAFRLDHVAVVGHEAIATTQSLIDAGDRGGVENVVNAHFTFDDDGLILSVRTFFDAESMQDPA